MKNITRLIVCISVFAGYSHSQARKQQRTTFISGPDIIRKVADQYAAARSYKDNGKVQLRTGTGASGKIKILNSFSTFFARPEFYRFQWKTNDQADAGWRVIWTTGNYFSTLNAKGERELEVDRGTTIARAAAVTRGASQTIAALLSGTVHGFRVSDMTQVSVVRQENFDGANCFVVRGHHPLGFAMDVWIGKNDFLIRKIRQINGDGSYQEEIRRNIELDVPIPQKMFQYKSIKTTPKNVT